MPQKSRAPYHRTSTASPFTLKWPTCLKEIWPREGFSGDTGGEGAGKTQPHSAYKTRELIRESEGLSMHVIPQSWSHLHILISVFPPIGLLLVLGLYIAGLKRDNDFTRQTCLLLFAGLGLLS